MIKHNKMQKNDITFCRGLIDKAQLEADRKSQELVSMFMSMQKHKMRDLEKQDDRTLQLESYENLLHDAINKLEDDLMDTEYRLGEALRDSIDTFFTTIKETIDLIKKDIADLIEEIKDKQETFHDELKNAALDQQREFIQDIEAQYPDGDYPLDDKELFDRIEIFAEKETTTANLDSFKEEWESSVSKQIEKQIANDVENEWKRYKETLENTVYDRNRLIVKQVNDNCKKFRDDVQKTFNEMREEDDG
jgi:hypothetical protein